VVLDRGAGVDEIAGQAFLASRYRRRTAKPRKRLLEVRFEENREILELFMATIAAIGRLPEAGEFPQTEAIQARHGSLQRVSALVKWVTRTAEWEEIARSRSEDLLV
jgi:hypothetical protein